MIDSQSAFLRSRDLHKSYKLEKRSLEVLRGVSLDVNRGEFVALKGSSGAGKSTLLHLLGGLDSPDSGDLWIDDVALGDCGDAELCRLRNRLVGFIFQAYHLLPELSAIENVCLAARMARVSVSKAESYANELLGRGGLGDLLDHPPSELSGGR